MTATLSLPPFLTLALITITVLSTTRPASPPALSLSIIIVVVITTPSFTFAIVLPRPLSHPRRGW